MNYPKSQKYASPECLEKIMGPNPIKLEEELLLNHSIPQGAVVCDLGSGQGLTSVFLAKEYGFRVYAADLWSDPEENRAFFRRMGLTDDQITPVKADATALPFERNFFDAVVSTDSYNYFGRDPAYLDEKLLPFVKPGGWVYIAIPGMVRIAMNICRRNCCSRGRRNSWTTCMMCPTGRTWRVNVGMRRYWKSARWNPTRKSGTTGCGRKTSMP